MPDKRRQKVGFHVMHADGGHVEAEGQRTAHHRADHQSADQAGARRERHRIDVHRTAAGVVEERVQQRHDLAHVVAGCEFRHHAAVQGVQFDLAVEGVGEQAGARVVEGDAGLVAGCLDAEDQH